MTATSTQLGPLIWVGRTPALQLACTQLWETAPTLLPVLVYGEPGTGRQLAARTLHALSPRHDQPFIRLDCAALHPDQAVSLLFGDDRPGALTQARGGTLFLDKLEALPMEIQPRLLQALGPASLADPRGPAPSDRPRLVAATAVDLSHAVCTDAFCLELYCRLAIVPIQLPPLRQRLPDLPLLVSHFLRQTCARMGRPAALLAPGALAALTAHPWPGNVWELKRLLERAIVLSSDYPITPELIDHLLQRASRTPEHQPQPVSRWTTPSSRLTAIH